MSRKPRKRTKNPARFLSDKEFGRIAGDLAIQTMFGMLGTALASCNPKLKEAMLNIATKGGIEIAPGIVILSTDPSSPSAALTDSTDPQSTDQPKQKDSHQS